MNQALVSKMAEVRLSAPPELVGIVMVLDEFLKFAEEPADDPILDSFGDALKVINKVRERVWEIQRRCDANVIGQFRQRSAATITGLIVLALVAMPDALLDVQLERLDNWVTSTNAAVKHNREEAERQDVIRREAEIEARARTMDITQIIKQAEANAQLSADAEGRILVKGQLSPDAKLMIGAARDRVVAFLRARDSQRERREVI